MRKQKITFIAVLALSLVFLLSSGLSSALNVDQTTIRAFVSNPTPQAGETVTITIFIQNNSTDPITLTYVGLHFDWMPNDYFYGFNLSSSAITIQPGADYIFGQNPIKIKIPETTSSGAHTYYVGLDGYQGTSDNIFSINAPTQELAVTGGSGATTSPTNTNSNGQPGASLDLLSYGAIAAVVIVVVLLVLVLMMRRRRKPSQKETPHEHQSPPSKPEQKPSGQDFSI